MRIIGLFVAIAALAIVPAANGDAVYHSQHIPLSPVAPERGSGFVENIHANGPIVFAHEEYVVTGALPLTSYSVELHVFSGTSCSAPLLFVAPTATITTNPAGNGSASAVFTPEDAAAIRHMTVYAYWTLSTSQGVAYETTCQTIQLD